MVGDGENFGFQHFSLNILCCPFSQVTKSAKVSIQEFLHKSFTPYKPLATSPFPKQQILDSSKLKEFADYNSKLHENGIKFFRWVENSVVKGEIAPY